MKKPSRWLGLTVVLWMYSKKKPHACLGRKKWRSQRWQSWPVAARASGCGARSSGPGFGVDGELAWEEENGKVLRLTKETSPVAVQTVGHNSERGWRCRRRLQRSRPARDVHRRWVWDWWLDGGSLGWALRPCGRRRNWIGLGPFGSVCILNVPLHPVFLLLFYIGRNFNPCTPRCINPTPIFFVLLVCLIFCLHPFYHLHTPHGVHSLPAAPCLLYTLYLLLFFFTPCASYLHPHPSFILVFLCF